MKAIILAAGRGSRMKNLTDESPKCLIKVRGKTLLNWQIEALNEAGIQEIAVVTGYKRDLLLNTGLREFHNERWSETNMVTSLECANEWLKSSPCIVSYSDIFYKKEAVEALLETNSSLAITYDPNWLKLWSERFSDPLSDAETFRISENNTLIEIGNKPSTVQEIEGQYMGLLKITTESWNEILNIRSNLLKEECDKMHMTGTLQKIIDAKNIIIKAIPYYGEWGEVDNELDLIYYNSN